MWRCSFYCGRKARINEQKENKIDEERSGFFRQFCGSYWNWLMLVLGTSESIFAVQWIVIHSFIDGIVYYKSARIQDIWAWIKEETKNGATRGGW